MTISTSKPSQPGALPEPALPGGKPLSEVPGGFTHPGGSREVPGVVPKPRSPRIDPVIAPISPKG